MVGPDVLDPSEEGEMLAALTDASAGVRVAAFRALARLPLSDPAWRAAGRYAREVLAGAGPVHEARSVIASAPSVPLRSVRDRVAELAGTDDSELSAPAAAALRAMGHAETVPSLLALPPRSDELHRIALTDVAGALVDVRAALHTRAPGSVDRFWLALALAFSGEDTELHDILDDTSMQAWVADVRGWLDAVIAIRRLPEPTRHRIAASPSVPDVLVPALTAPPGLAWGYPPRSGSSLRPGWSGGKNPGFASAPDTDADADDRLDELSARLEHEMPSADPWRSAEEDAELAGVLDVMTWPYVISHLMARASTSGWNGHSITDSNRVVVMVHAVQGAFRPDVAGLFATYLAVTTRSWQQWDNTDPDAAATAFADDDDEGGPRSFCLQIGWIVSRGGLPGLVTALSGALRTSDPAERVAALHLIADAASYVTQEIAPLFGGGENPDQQLPWDVVDETDTDTRPERYVAAAVVDVRGTPPSEPLDRNARYWLRVAIGADLDGDLMRGEPPFPDDWLPESTGGRWLTLVVHGEHIDVPTGPHRIYLPPSGTGWTCRCRPGTTHTCRPEDRGYAIELPFRTPDEAVVAAAVLKLYADATLVQTVEVMLPVGAVGRLRPSATVVHTLGPTVDDATRHGPCAVSLLCEPGRRQGHLLHIGRSSGAPIVFELTDAAAAESARAVRAELFDCHLVQRDGRWTSRYTDEHAASPQVYEADLRRLAVAGADLYLGLFGGQGEPIHAELAQAVQLSGRPAEMQVARAVNTRLTVPWQLVYDMPIDDGRAPTVCRSVIEFGPGGTASATEIPAACPHADDHDPSGMLCPFGFWGLAHHVECPPPMRERPLPDVTGPDRPADLVVALHAELEHSAWTDHESALVRLGARPAVRSEPLLRDAVLDGADVLYLFCHGVRMKRAGGAAPRPVLDLGAGGQVSTLTLNNWRRGRPQVRWDRRRPLVVLNGCHTGELLPDVPADLVTLFMDTLGAAGVVATEVAVEAAAAAQAMELFLGDLVAGASVGAAMRRTRWALISKGNVLGLAYGAYCDSRLRLPSLI